jgi:ADP-ribosylglycohydrolase
MNERIFNPIVGFIIGDSTGIPYEFKKRGTFECTDMRASTFSDVHFPLPLGSWSDDTSLLLCVLDALTIKEKYNHQETPPMKIEEIKKRNEKINEKVYSKFRENSIKWMTIGKFTNHGYKIPFDIGNSCRKGILAMMSGIKNKTADHETSNGNGGLMRVPPLAFFKYENDEELLKYIKLFNECSHNHKISHIGCLIYIKLAQNLMNDMNIRDALLKTVDSIDEKYKIPEYKRIWNLSLLDEDIDNIKSSGYVVDTLEASIWCCNKSATYKETILSAVNLGDDTDTIAAISGFLSGIYHKDIPEKWISNIRKLKMVKNICKKYK